MSVWYFATALVKAPGCDLGQIVLSRPERTQILHLTGDLVLMEEHGRIEKLSNYVFGVGTQRTKAVVVVQWCVEADRGGIWAIRAGRLFYQEEYEFQDPTERRPPVTQDERDARSLEAEMDELQKLVQTTT